MMPSKTANESQAGADRVTASGPPQGQSQPPAASSETRPQSGEKAESRAEDELDEGKRLRPKINSNSNLVRRGTGGIRQERAPDSVRAGSGAPDSVRAVDPNFPGSDPCFSSDLDQPVGPNGMKRAAILNLDLNQDFPGSDPDFSGRNP